MSFPPPVELLRTADRERALPRLGGMARPNGVVIVSERFWAFATMDGNVLEGRMPQPSERFDRVPLARGLLRLYASVSPLLRRSGVAGGRERLFLLAAILVPFAFYFLPRGWANAAGAVVTVALVAVLLRGRTLHLHGAEHRAIAATEERRLEASWNGAARPTRFSPRCGTNFAAIAIPVALLADWLAPLPTAVYTPAIVLAFSLALSMELWRLVQRRSSGHFGRVVLLPGLLLQRLTTREPRLDETQVALVAVASVLRRELR